jgi:hypothetical protein
LTVVLDAPAPPGGATVIISSAHDVVSGGTISIASGATSGTTTVTTHPVAGTLAVPLTAGYGLSTMQRTVTISCAPFTSPPATLPEGEIVLVDDLLPAGVSLVSNANGPLDWSTLLAASGTCSLVHPAAGEVPYSTSVTGLSERLDGDDALFVYARIGECAMPRQILLRALTTSGPVTAYWGQPLGLAPGSAVNMGPLPPAGTWTKLDLPLRSLDFN